MKNDHWYFWLPAIFLCICNLSAVAQVTPGRFQQFISTSTPAAGADTVTISKVQSFYRRINYKPAWILKENAADCDILLNDLELSAGMGLRAGDYQFEYIQSFRKRSLRLMNATDSMQAEILISSSAIHFYTDVAYGNIKPQFGYNGLNYTPSCYDIVGLLAEYMLNKKLGLLASYLSTGTPEIAAIEKKLKWFARVMNDSKFGEAKIISNKVSSANKPLMVKLYQLGIIDTVSMSIADSVIRQKLKEAQLQFGLLHDGELRGTVLHELNIPLSVRVQQLTLSLHYYRWLNCLVQSQSVIVVNIPAAYLKVYGHNKVILEMRIIAGKRSTPTPALTSRVEEVILYPYWHVPYSIATKEILPVLKKNPGYINTGNYQVLNAAGKIVDPHSVNWNALSKSYFPYIIRQSTGCDNSLGLLKLNFYNPFGVYLHDTPGKNAFLLNRRYLSHGCMRLGKPEELGRLILKDNSVAIDTLVQKGCLYNQSPVVVQAQEKMPLIVWYNPAGIDAEGRVLYFEDVYGKLGFMKPK